MQTSAKEQDKLLRQMAIRQVSGSKNSAFFNLLFPFSIVAAYSILYVAPVAFMQILKVQYKWLVIYLDWSTPVIAIAACMLYGFLRQRKLKPVMEKLRADLDREEKTN
jgi:hypothetical protein